jgi:streptogramin lyase
MGCCIERLGRRAAFALLLSFTACATQAAAPPQPARTNTHPERVSQIPLPASGYVYDVAVADGSTWVTTQAGLYEIDPATSEAVDVLPREYLFRVVVGHGAVWISTGSDGHVLRVDPTSKSVTAEIDVREGPVTELAISKDAVWVSATSELVRIDPGTNEVVARLRSERGFGDIGFGEAGLWVIVGANEDGEVWQIDAATGWCSSGSRSPTRASGTRSQ